MAYIATFKHHLKFHTFFSVVISRPANLCIRSPICMLTNWAFGIKFCWMVIRNLMGAAILMSCYLYAIEIRLLYLVNLTYFNVWCRSAITISFRPNFPDMLYWLKALFCLCVWNGLLTIYSGLKDFFFVILHCCLQL